MSRTWSLEIIEAHMRSQSSTYLQDWLRHSQEISEKLMQAGFEVDKDSPVDKLAIKILQERGDWND